MAGTFLGEGWGWGTARSAQTDRSPVFLWPKHDPLHGEGRGRVQRRGACLLVENWLPRKWPVVPPSSERRTWL